MCKMKSREQKHGTELADIFRHHGDSYCQKNTLTPEQYKVFHAIVNCRTRALGGHVDECDQCGAKQNSYNSCRNRHCPKCESFKAAEWLEARQAELLPVPYFHVVFTLPHELNTLVQYNKRLLHNLLFQSAWETLKTLGKDPKRLNGEMGMLSILHTWGQNLSQHNHVHCIVPGGACTSDGKWNPTKKKFLFPVKVMSQIFRGVYVTKLRELYETGELTLPPSMNIDALLDELMTKSWNIYAKEPFAGPKQLLNYLGRYTHKIAISNYRILSCDENAVTFKWRDYADDNKVKIMKLHPHEFIRRFLQHVLPNGFMRIRSFGFLSNAGKKKKIPTIQKLLDYQPNVSKEKPDTRTRMLEITGKDISICPFCKEGRLNRVGTLNAKFGSTQFDTS
ncbi:MAG: IS91 family transposase [Methyloprofundus sp.]|nr:IS91 family transposase [Methyloprofundus sp.]